MLDQPALGAVEHGAHAAAAVVPAHDDVLDPQRLDGELQHRHAVEVGRIDDVRDIAVHEHLAGLEAGDDVGRHAAVGAADPQVLGGLQGGQAVEVARVGSGSFPCPPAVLLQQVPRSLAVHSRPGSFQPEERAAGFRAAFFLRHGASRCQSPAMMEPTGSMVSTTSARPYSAICRRTAAALL